MKLHVDTEADAFYLRLSDSRVSESEEIEPGIVLDLDEAGHVVGIEILRWSTRLPSIAIPQVQVEATERALSPG